MYLRLYFFLLSAYFCSPSLTQENQVRSGNYFIRYCGKGPGSKAERLQTSLPQYWDHLQLVLADVRRGTASKAYRAFFKSQENAAYVERVFQNIANGALLQVPVPGAPSQFTRPVLPSILCLDSNIPNWEQLQAVCNLGPPAAAVPHREIVLLCPAFWDLDDAPQRSDCPRVRRNVFVPDDYRVSYNRFGAFVHEFAHVYIANWDTNETYNPMEAVQLSAELSLRNPNNYALYAAMVQAGCPKYVNPNLLRDEERILKETSVGATSDPAALSSSAAEASGSVDSPPQPTTPSDPPPAAGLGNDILPTSFDTLISPASSDAPAATTTPSPMMHLR